MASPLEDFEKVLEQTQQIFTEENELLKQGSLPSEFLEKKNKLLNDLDTALNSLKQATASSPSQRTLLKTLQGRIMKLLMLDKENEQLLMKQSVSSMAKVSTAQRLESIYKKSAQ